MSPQYHPSRDGHGPAHHVSKLRSGVVLAALLSGLMGTPVNAQLPIQWQANFGGSGDEFLFAFVQSQDGGYLLGGSSASDISGNKSQAGLGDSDYWLVKISSAGAKQWERVIGGDDFDEPYSLLVTSDGGYLLGGSSYSGISGNKTSAGQGNSDFWLVKTREDGEKEWEQTYGGTGNDVLFAVRMASNGGYILLGQSDSGVTGNKTTENQGGLDYWLIKVDESGVKQWEKVYGGGDDDYPFGMEGTKDGGYILAGSSRSDVSGNKTSGNYGDYDYWMIKVDVDGNKEWEQVFGGDGWDEVNVVQQTQDGGYVVAGSSESSASGNKNLANIGGWDWWFIKLDGSGDKQWESVFGGTEGSDYLNNVRQTSDGGFLLLGTSWSGATGNKTSESFGESDYWMVKVDKDGTKQWEQALGGSQQDYPWMVEPTSDGGYLVAGHSESAVSGNKTSAEFGLLDYWVAKVAPDTELFPRLSITLAAESVIVSWPSPSISYLLERSDNLGTTVWSDVSGSPEDNGETKSVTVPREASPAYFRLKRR